MADGGRFQLWTPSQRGVLIGFVLLLSLVFIVKVVLNRQHIADPQPTVPARFGELADRLDPNVATWEDLAVLPQLGEKRAKEIVAYREQFRADKRGETPFRQIDDLLKIKGIGVAMIETLRPHLMFPATRPATGPAYNPA